MEPRITALSLRIYEAAIDGQEWNEVLSDLVDVLGCDMALLQRVQTDDRGNLRSSVAATLNIPSDAIIEYGRDLVGYDRWIQIAVQAADMEVVPLSEMAPAESWVLQPRLRHITEHGIPAWHAMGARFATAGRSAEFAALSLLNTRNTGNFRSNTDAALRQLLPHLRRAIQAETRLSGVGSPFSEAAEVLSDGVAVLNRASRPQAMNAAMRALLTDGWFTQVQSVLEPADRQARARFAALIEAATAAHLGFSTQVAGELILRHPTRQGGPLLVRIMPLRAAAPAALVFVHDSDRARPPMPETLRMAFGLTRSEANLAIMLFEGQTLTEAAAARGVSLPTVRTQLSAILAKMNVPRQVDLVRAIALWAR